MSDEKLEFNLPPVPSEIQISEDSRSEGSRSEDLEKPEEPTTFEPPPPPDGISSPVPSSEMSESEMSESVPSSGPSESYRPPAYSEEHTFFPPPPTPPPPESQPHQADFQPDQTAVQQPVGQATVVQSTVVQEPAASPPVQSNAYGQSASGPGSAASAATIDPLLQYRGQEEDYYQQESSAPPAPTARRPRRHRAGRPSARFWIQFAILLGLIILAVVMMRVFVFESFYITSDSMAPTLDSGDRILVNKLSSGRAGRGDLVVFSRPANDSTDSEDDLVKRVVALEGETITLAQGRVFIGDQLLLEPYLEDDQATRIAPGSRLFDACVDQVSPRSCTLAPGYVYVLGDSRNFSYDSRFFGPIAKSSIVGRAFWRVWPLGDFGGI